MVQHSSMERKVLGSILVWVNLAMVPSFNNLPTLRHFLQKEVVLPGFDSVEMIYRQLVTHLDIYLKKKF